MTIYGYTLSRFIVQCNSKPKQCALDSASPRQSTVLPIPYAETKEGESESTNSSRRGGGEGDLGV